MDIKYLTLLLCLTSLPSIIVCITSDKKNENDNETIRNNTENNSQEDYEEEPQSSPLIRPGYNLPGPIFNNGQPFYVEKDPITGQIDFNVKTPAGKSSPYNYDYIDEEPSTNIFDKSNIDRKDGGYGSHRPNDINQLSPNFHDFLPVKYNPDKYVYPLISSSYANTKIQGNVNRFDNHKYVEKTTPKSVVRASTVSPMYYTTTTTVPTTTTVKNLLETGYYTTEEPDYDYYTTKSTIKTTKRPYSIFDELFGDYEEPKVEIKPEVKPPLFGNIPSINFGEKTTTTTTTTEQPKNDTNTVEDELEYEYEYEDERINETTTTTTAKTTTTPTTSATVKSQSVYSNFHQNYKDPIESLFETKINVQSPEYVSITSETPPITMTTTTKTTTTTTPQTIPETSTTFVTKSPGLMRVTSLPLGNNHISGRPPIISIASLKEQLNNEKVTQPDKESFISNSFRPLYTPQKPLEQKIQPGEVVKETLTFTGSGQVNSNYSWTVPQKNQNDNFPENMPPSNVYKQEVHSNYSWTIPEQTKKPVKVVPVPVSIQMPASTGSVYSGVKNDYNLQQVGAGYSIGQGGGGYGHGSVFTVGTSYAGGTKYKPAPTYQFAQVGTTNYSFPEVGSSIKIHPVSGSEASLSIGSPAGNNQKVKGQVMDEKLDLKDPEVTKHKATNNKIVFPEDKPTQNVIQGTKTTQQKEILSLYSKPMLHQLPSELMPPVTNNNRQNNRPPWDPRPGHFYQGRPEYARPPRPPKPEVYKRIDGLPNILPQFRPNAKIPNRDIHHDIPINSNYMQRQPLLERPSNRPIGFFEKLLPPPPPPPKRILELRKPNHQHIQPERKQEKIESKHHFVYPTPPKVPIANRRNSDIDGEIATLQMLHAKQADKLNTLKPNVPPPFKINFKDVATTKPTTDKPLYVVYPVNSNPVKLDALNVDNKETVVIGTRNEQPLPPSKIDFPTYPEQKPILKPKDSPVLKPQKAYPIKTDFPYPLERPNFGEKQNENVETTQTTKEWDVDTESRIINGNRIYNNEPISVTLKTYTQNPIAIAYTPTEPTDDRYSMPNFGSSVIGEIRNKDDVVTGGKEFTVSAVMHAHKNHEENEYPMKLEFQAPFHASVNVGSNSGWSVVRERAKEMNEDATTLLPETSSKFDIENFKPQLFGGFKPIYEMQEGSKGEDNGDREE